VTDAGADPAVSAAPDTEVTVHTSAAAPDAKGRTDTGAEGRTDSGADAAMSAVHYADSGPGAPADPNGVPPAPDATGAREGEAYAEPAASAWDAGSLDVAAEHAPPSEEPRSAWGTAMGAMSSFGKWLLPPHGPAPEVPGGAQARATAVEDPRAEPAPVQAPEIGHAGPAPGAPGTPGAPGADETVEAGTVEAEATAGPEDTAAAPAGADSGAAGSDTLVEDDQLRAPGEPDPGPGPAEPPIAADGGDGGEAGDPDAAGDAGVEDGAHELGDEPEAGPIGAHERIVGAEGEALPTGAHERDPAALDPSQGAHEALDAPGPDAEEGGDSPREDGESPEP
jgi:hypothetical protein